MGEAAAGERSDAGLLERSFKISVIFKGLDGLLELAGALVLLIAGPGGVNHAIAYLTQRELSGDPHDFVASHLVNAGQHLASGGTLFGVIYLASHGAIKVGIVIGLLLDKLWAYPASEVALGLFVVYQIYRIAIDRSIGLVLLTIFDLVVMWLIWAEYRQHQRRRSRAQEHAA